MANISAQNLEELLHQADDFDPAMIRRGKVLQESAGLNISTTGAQSNSGLFGFGHNLSDESSLSNSVSMIVNTSFKLAKAVGDHSFQEQSVQRRVTDAKNAFNRSHLGPMTGKNVSISQLGKPQVPERPSFFLGNTNTTANATTNSHNATLGSMTESSFQEPRQAQKQQPIPMHNSMLMSSGLRRLGNTTQESFQGSSTSTISASGSANRSANLSSSFCGRGRRLAQNTSGQDRHHHNDQMSQSFSVGHSRSYHEIF